MGRVTVTDFVCNFHLVNFSLIFRTLRLFRFPQSLVKDPSCLGYSFQTFAMSVMPSYSGVQVSKQECASYPEEEPVCACACAYREGAGVTGNVETR